MKLNDNIELYNEERYVNTKASEEYIHVLFKYPDVKEEWDGWIPVEYRRTGVSIPAAAENELNEHLNNIYEQMHPMKYKDWELEQEKFWNARRAVETRDIFNTLKNGKGHCRNCEISNPNFARRIQDIKEMGYTLATQLNYHCPVCGNNKSTRLLLLPIARVELAGNGYETWSPALRERIVRVLGGIDVYENKVSRNCLPDHKFSEIRWDDDTKGENPEDMTEQEIGDKFQLLSNQRNQQKREVCRNCYQTGKRGKIYGIEFYYEGTDKWDLRIPQKGKAAEKGCVGCPWYDIAKWREELNKLINREKKR